MSCQHFIWAMEEGRIRKLAPSDRLVLLAMADHANSIGLCWPSLPTLADYTGLSPRTCHTAVHRLEAVGLVSIELRGRVSHYTLLMPSTDAKPLQPLQGSKSHNGSEHCQPLQPLPDKHYQPLQRVLGSEARPLQPLQPHPCKSPPSTLATIASKPTKYNLPRNLERAYAREEAVRINSPFEGSKQGPPPPRDHEPTPAEVAAARRAEAETIRALPPALGAVFASLGHSMRHIAKPDGVVSPLDRHEQADLLRPRIKPSYAPPAYLAAARADLAARAAANQARATADSTA